MIWGDAAVPPFTPAKALFSHVLELVERGITGVRDTLQGICLAAVERSALTSFEKTLADFATELTPTGQTRLRMVVIGRPKPFHPRTQKQVYLIAREALLNALRHSQATRIELEVEYLRKKMRLVVRDNGCGFSARRFASQDSHRGLMAMRQRAANVSARLRLWSKPGIGTEVEVAVHLDGERHRRAIKR